MAPESRWRHFNREKLFKLLKRANHSARMGRKAKRAWSGSSMITRQPVASRKVTYSSSK